MSNQLSFDILINLSADEFSKLLIDKGGMSDKDILLMVTRFEHDILDKIKAKDGESHERYIFFNRVLKIMYLALQAEENIGFWKNVAIRSKMQGDFHAANAAIYYEELIKYKAVEEVINSGKLDEYIEQVKQRNKK